MPLTMKSFSDPILPGRWNPLEEAKLAKVIKELNEATGLDPLGTEAPWDLVKQRMDGSRTRTQCRRKWRVSHPCHM